MIDARAVGRERTPEEKLRRHLYGDSGARFSQGKRMCILGGGGYLAVSQLLPQRITSYA